MFKMMVNLMANIILKAGKLPLDIFMCSWKMEYWTLGTRNICLE